MRAVVFHTVSDIRLDPRTDRAYLRRIADVPRRRSQQGRPSYRSTGVGIRVLFALAATAS
jgi:hypothetical protein